MESGGRAKDSGGELSLVGIHLVQIFMCYGDHGPHGPAAIRDVRFRGQSGHHLLILGFSAFDPAYRKVGNRGWPLLR